MSARDDVERVAHDLEAEEQVLDDLVVGLDADDWATETPAEGWTVRQTIGHLASSEEFAAIAATDADAFARELTHVIEHLEEFESGLPGDLASLSDDELLARWRTSRQATIDAVRAKDPDERIPWVGPSMRARAFLTARLMETWAHGHDLFDTFGVVPPATDRLRHIAHLGVITRGFAYINRGLEPPASEIRVELDPPGGGEPWTWGPADAADRIVGSAEDFCLLVTQRRSVLDTDLCPKGRAANEWMEIAQAFGGPATDPRPSRD